MSSRRFPPVRQEFLELAGRLGGQALEHVGQVGVGIKVVELCRLDQGHDRGGALTGAEGSGKEPVAAVMEGHA